jgi:hypothetical protein
MNFPNFVNNEIPGGVIDGVNQYFHVIGPVPNPAYLKVYLNGVLQILGVDYTFGPPPNFTFVTAPAIGDTLVCCYSTGPSLFTYTPGVLYDFEEPTISGNQFTLQYYPQTQPVVYRNGLFQVLGIDYNQISAKTFEFTAAYQQTPVYCGNPNNTPVPYGQVITKADTCAVSYVALGNCPFVPAFQYAEAPVGVPDGVATTFTLAYEPVPYSSLELYRNGVLLKQGFDYILTSGNITFLPAAIPQVGDTLLSYYRYVPTSTLRTQGPTRQDLVPYIRRYLNDINGRLWDDATIVRLIAQGDNDISSGLNLIWIRVPLNIQLGVGTYQIDQKVKEITRITYRGFKVDMLTQAQVAMLSPVYRTQQSRPRWATWQFEGYRTLRLYPVPYENLPVLSDATTVYQDTNLLSECVVSCFVSIYECMPYSELPDYLYRRTVRYYTLWKCFAKEGLGQVPDVAMYWKSRYDKQMELNKTSVDRLYTSKQRQLSDLAIQRPWKKQHPILPPNYGPIVGY